MCVVCIRNTLTNTRLWWAIRLFWPPPWFTPNRRSLCVHRQYYVWTVIHRMIFIAWHHHDHHHHQKLTSTVNNNRIMYEIMFAPTCAYINLPCARMSMPCHATRWYRDLANESRPYGQHDLIQYGQLYRHATLWRILVFFCCCWLNNLTRSIETNWKKTTCKQCKHLLNVKMNYTHNNMLDLMSWITFKSSNTKLKLLRGWWLVFLRIKSNITTVGQLCFIFFFRCRVIEAPE